MRCSTHERPPRKCAKGIGKLSRNQTAPQKDGVVLACPKCHRTFEPTRTHGGAAIEMKKLGTNELLIRRETVKVICMHCDHDFMVNKSLLPDGLGSTKKKMSNS